MDLGPMGYTPPPIPNKTPTVATAYVECAYCHTPRASRVEDCRNCGASDVKTQTPPTEHGQKWHHFAVTSDGRNTKSFVDGIEIERGTKWEKFLKGLLRF